MTDLAKSEQAARALTFLQTEGYDVKALWHEHTRRLNDVGTPHADDLMFELPADYVPLVEHFNGAEPETLQCNIAHLGRSYLLSPGQREWLRDNFGLTPTRTVTIRILEAWPGTRHPKVIKFTSDLHVDPRLRKHTLVDFTITHPGTFFREAQALDQQLREQESRPGVVIAIVDNNYCTVQPPVGTPCEARYTGLRIAVGDEVQIKWDNQQWELSRKLTKSAAAKAVTSTRKKLSFDEMFAELENNVLDKVKFNE